MTGLRRWLEKIKGLGYTESMEIKCGYYLLASDRERLKTSRLRDIFINHFAGLPQVDTVEGFDVIFFLVSSGGCEQEFKMLAEKGLPDDFFILSDAVNNSLAAGLEIISFLRTEYHYQRPLIYAEDNEALHLLKRYYSFRNTVHGKKAGIIGGCSAWLIGSPYDAARLKSVLGIELEIIEIKDLPVSDLRSLPDNLDRAQCLCREIRGVCADNNFDFLSIRCFDLIPVTGTTGCLAVSALNDAGLTTSCEGDIPSLISMIISSNYFQTPVFMANPSALYAEDNSIVFAHCTIPTRISGPVEYTTHFESGTGIALKTEPEGPGFILFKMDGSLREFRLAFGQKMPYEFSTERCRTQIRLKLDEDITCLTDSPIGNHVIIIPAEKDEMEGFRRFVKLISTVCSSGTQARSD